MNNNLIYSILERELQSKNLIFPFISGLTGREQKILEMRSRGQILQEVGNKLELTRERVRQIEQKAKTKIRFQNDIMATLTQRLGEYLFTESEIERAFLGYLKEGSIAEKKLRWQDFSKKLWGIKQKDEKE